MEDIKGKTVIVTGGARGIGKACCLAFARAGANVVFTYKSSVDEAAKLEEAIIKIGAGCMSIQVDVQDYQSCRDVIKAAAEKFERVDILINNAGITRDKALMMMNLDDWSDVVNTNLGGMFNMTRAVITTFLKQKRGCVINMSSVSGLVGMPRQTNYSASKAGIIGFSKALAKEVAPYNVRVNVLCPGYIDTDMVGNMQDDLKEKVLKSIPSGRLGMPEEVADFSLFLASDKASYITGSVMSIDGGLTAT